MNELLNEIGLYVSWQEFGHTATAMITGYDGWFDIAVNCHRAGSMGKIDADGYCSRCWATGYITDGYFEGGLRPATWFEVKKYLELTMFEPITPQCAAYQAPAGLFYDLERQRFYGLKLKSL